MLVWWGSGGDQGGVGVNASTTCLFSECDCLRAWFACVAVTGGHCYDPASRDRQCGRGRDVM